MLGKLWTESKERISGSIPFVNRTIKTGTNYLQKRYGLSLLNLQLLKTEVGKQ
jgi:hypothetical protein